MTTESTEETLLCMVPDCGKEAFATMSISQGPDQPICDDCIGSIIDSLKAHPEQLLGMRIEGDDEDGYPLTIEIGDI